MASSGKFETVMIDSLESVTKHGLVKIGGSFSGEVPYRYIGAMNLTSQDEFNQKDATS